METETNQSNSKFWQWAWREAWDHARKHIIVPGGIMITTFISGTVIAIIRGEGWRGLLFGLGAGLGGLLIYILIVLIWKRIIAARQIHLKEEQWSAQEVLEYALKHSGIKEKSKIETELRKVALRNEINVEVQRGGDSIWVIVPKDVFLTHAIDLSSDCLYNFRNSEVEPYGTSLYFYGYEIRKLWKEKKN